MTHPFHKHHTCSLLRKPYDQECFFDCDACGNHGHGFSYHCKLCNLDLHILCASMTLSLSHPSHLHPLHLAFSPPYPDKLFNCDICKAQGGNHWLYRCNHCGFDAHLECAKRVVKTQIQPIETVSRSSPDQIRVLGQQQHHAVVNGFPLLNVTSNQVAQNPFMVHGALQNNQQVVLLQMLQRLRAQHGLNRPYLQGGGGVGSGVGGYAGGGGNGGLGGGGWGDIIQLLITGGIGGGGGDVLGSLMGGLSGGRGGMDALQALLGGGTGLDALGFNGGGDLLGGALGGGAFNI